MNYDEINTGSNINPKWDQLGLDSSGQAGPTLQKVADQYQDKQNRAAGLESLFGMLTPLAMYSGEAEGAYLPSMKMQNAQGLAKIFQDWWKGGTPTVNVPIDKWPDILKAGKFKNQMEVAGTHFPEAWDQRIKVEKNLGGFPYPIQGNMKRYGYGERTPKEEERYNSLIDDLRYLKKDIAAGNDVHIYGDNPYARAGFLNGILKDMRKLETIPERSLFHKEYSPSLAKQNPVYGHVYNPKYTPEWTARSFGNTHAEMSDLVKDRSQYVLGDSFNPFVKKTFSSQDMSGETSALERALFNRKQKPGEWSQKEIEKDPTRVSKYMEMWIPNELSQLNNVRNVYIPGKVMDESVDRAVPVREISRVMEKRQQKAEDFLNSLSSFDVLTGTKSLWE